MYSKHDLSHSKKKYSVWSWDVKRRGSTHLPDYLSMYLLPIIAFSPDASSYCWAPKRKKEKNSSNKRNIFLPFFCKPHAILSGWLDFVKPQREILIFLRPILVQSINLGTKSLFSFWQQKVYETAVVVLTPLLVESSSTITRPFSKRKKRGHKTQWSRPFKWLAHRRSSNFSIQLDSAPADSFSLRTF